MESTDEKKMNQKKQKRNNGKTSNFEIGFSVFLKKKHSQFFATFVISNLSTLRPLTKHDLRFSSADFHAFFKSLSVVFRSWE